MEEKLVAEQFRNDYSGDVFLERDLKNPFNDLARDCGIDLTNQFLLGVNFTKNVKLQTITFFVTNVSKSYDDIKIYLKKNDTLPCKKFYINMDINDFFKYTKRFSFLYTQKNEFIEQTLDITKEVAL